MRATVATAIKYTIADPTNEHDDLLRPTLSGLLPLLKDESLVWINNASDKDHG